MSNSIFAIKSTLISTDTSLPTIYRDKLLDGAANSGVRFIADLAFGYCYPGGSILNRPAPTAPVNGSLIADVADISNGSYALASGQTVSYAGGGFDYSATSTFIASGSGIVLPSGVLNDVWTAYGGNSQFGMVCCYVKLPTLADMSTSGQQGAVIGQYHADFITIMLSAATTPSIQFLRELTSSTIETNTLDINSLDWGQFAQVAFWRNGTSRGYTLRTARDRTTTTTTTSGVANTNSFASTNLKFGTNTSAWSPTTSANTVKNFRAYRCFVENLARSGRDPLTVLEADWLRVVARNVFS